VKSKLSAPWAATPSSNRREPTGSEIATGFPCGPADKELFNELFYRLSGMESELQALNAGAGLTPSESDLQQVARAVRSQAMNFVPAAAVTGTANAIALAFNPTFTALGQLVGTPLVFLAEASNTGAATLAVDGLAATAITWPDGTALVAGDIANGALIAVRYDGAAFRLEYCLSPTQVRGLITSQGVERNVVPITWRTRASLGPTTGFVTYQTGTYVKREGPSQLVVALQSHGYAAASAASIMRVTFGAQTLDFMLSNSTSSQTGGGANGRIALTGIAAGSINWTLAVGRPDGTSHTTVINPTSADVSFMSNNLGTTLTFSEV
jgi:hypothetical protein